MFGQGFGGNHHGHHHGHHGHGKGQGFNQGFNNQGFNNQGQGFNNQGFNNQQQYGWQPIPGQHYKIVSAMAHNMVLDVSQNAFDFNNLIIFNWGNTANQKFYFQSIGGNKYGIFSAKTNQTVEVPQGSQHNGTRILVSQAHKQVNEFWELVPASFNGLNNAFYIKSFCGKALDVKGGVCQNEAHIIQWDYNGGKNQIWVIEQC
jgi:hypothetical protein